MKLLEHQRFRAGYDFLLLRCESGELDPAIGEWWTDFIGGDTAARESLLSQGGKDRAPKKRRRRSSNAKSRRTGDGFEGGASAGDAGARDDREERDVRSGHDDGDQRDD
jgi:poly(A) polymerase